jgi:hypothetical protein
MTLKQSSAVHIQALYPADGILPGSSFKLQLLVINLASVPGGQLVNSPTAQSLGRCASCKINLVKIISILTFFILSFSASGLCSDPTGCLFPIKQNGKWGFIDDHETLKIPCKFDSVQNFSDNLASVLVDSLWGYIDTRGVLVIPAKFRYTEPFSCGLAKVNSTEKAFPTVFINTNGDVAFKCKYRLVYSFTYNRALAYINNKACYLDKTGKVVIKTQYSSGGLFNDGIAQVWDFKRAEFIDTTGTRIAYFNEMGHQDFAEGWASVLGNEKTFYINKAGQKIKIKSRSFYIDKLGNIRLDNTIDSLVYFSFHNGLAEVCIPGTGHKSGFIDTTGRIVIPITYDYVSPFFGDYAIVYSAKKKNIINKKGEIVADISEYEKYFPKHMCN